MSMPSGFPVASSCSSWGLKVSGANEAGSQGSGAAALAQVTSDAAKEGEIRAKLAPESGRDRMVPGQPICQITRAPRMRLVWSGYGTVPRGTTHRAGCPVIFAIRS